MTTAFRAAVPAALALACAPQVHAHEVNALDHAPIGVMGDHRHNEGEWMVSFRTMHMEMSGAQVGTDDIDADTIVTTIPNRFAGMPMQPPTLRIVPTEMRMDMHMAGVMYGLTDRITLMGMANYVTKEMDHVTYAGGMGTDTLGTFRTSPSGFGDTKISALVGLSDTIHLNAGISIPTGSITERGEALTPMNMTADVRLPYPMQLGSGTWDLEPGITWRGQSDTLGWGAQLRGIVRMGENDEGYAFGDQAKATAWLAYSLDQAVAVSGRVEAVTQGPIDGIDAGIMGPIQTANPDFSGGDSVTAFAGVNFVATHGPLATWRLGVELAVPLVQDLNGPQMPNDWSLTVGVQKSL